MQFNKRDLTDEDISLMSIEKMQQDLNRQLKVPAIPSSALKGNGVGNTLNACLKLVLKSIQKFLREEIVEKIQIVHLGASVVMFCLVRGYDCSAKKDIRTRES